MIIEMFSAKVKPMRVLLTSIGLTVVFASAIACAPIGSLSRPPGEELVSLKAYTTCQFEDGLTAVSVLRWPGLVSYRMTETSEGLKRVSVADGYRMLFVYPGTDPFVNFHVEKSQPSHYLADKKTVTDSLKHLASQKRGSKIDVEHYGGFDFYAVNNPRIGIGGAISMYVLFADSDETIVTMYFLDQAPSRRKFQTFEEYKTLRDRFLGRYAACLRQQ